MWIIFLKELSINVNNFFWRTFYKIRQRHQNTLAIKDIKMKIVLQPNAINNYRIIILKLIFCIQQNM